MNTKDIGILAAVGVAWYYFTKTPAGSATATTYPPGTPATNPLTALLNALTGNKPAAGGSSGGISGGATPSGGVPGGNPGYVNPANVSKATGPTGLNDPCYPNLAPGCPGYVDSLDPCDVTSTAYDAFTCACSQNSTPGCPGFVDSEDPCDPNSTAYDPATCNDINAQATIADSMDPCDPSSVMYDPTQCVSG